MHVLYDIRMPQLDREVLFGNEAFTIGVAQVVSGAAAVGALSQFEALAGLAGRISVLIFLTLSSPYMVLALVSAVLAAYIRHQYKMWDIKAGAAGGLGDQELAQTRGEWANRDLDRMRRGMTLSIDIVCLGFFELVGALWWGIAAEWVCP